MITIEPPSTFPILAALRNCTPARVRRLALLCLIGLGAIGPSAAAQPADPVKPGAHWKLTWSDEFNAPAGSAPDPRKWTFDLGGHNSNHELETYTARPVNIHQKDGNLVITALREEHTGVDGIAPSYTSARIKTAGLFSQAYGRFEARMQLPLGQGIWPAFWMLGDDIATVGWPKSGEIDIVENIGEPAISHSTLHGPGYSGGKGLTARYDLPAGQAVNTAFHLYAVEWAPNDIKFFLDDKLVVEHTPADLPPGATWVYDHPFFLILNLAVGGDWPGNPGASTAFPQQMLIDYVRVYRRTPSP